jgi:predicted ArsR family transcriptional regulator
MINSAVNTRIGKNILMKNTREKILLRLLSFPESTINELAEAAGINGISVRHHLAALEADNMVTALEERHGVGRPRLIYSLTDKGLEVFPTNYIQLTNRLLTTLRSLYSHDEIGQVFREIGNVIAKPHKIETRDISLKQRLEITTKVLKTEGYVIETQNTEEGYWITLLNCPFHNIAREHPEVCLIDQTLMTKILETTVTKQTCILDGEDHCVFFISNREKKESDEQ